MSQYADFEIKIGGPVSAVYPVNVRSAAGLEDNDTLVLPTTDTRFINFKTKLEFPELGATEDEVIEFGMLIYETLFKGKVWALFIGARDDAARNDRSLRIKLSIPADQAEVAAFPWEFACDDAGIPLATEHSFCRFLADSQPYPALKVDSRTKIKLLLTSALPSDISATLDIDAEVTAIRTALKPLEDAGQLSIIEVRHLTADKLQTALEDEKPHIVHYIGHGIVEGSTGKLVLENEQGTRQDMSARTLAANLRNSGTRLVVLNACKTGMVVTNLLRGIAPTLMRANIPAVVAMQSSILDDAGRKFAERFYRALASGVPIDGCVARGRKAVINANIGNLDWGLATLYMRAPDGVLFEGLGAAGQQGTTAAEQSAPTQGNNANTINFGSDNNMQGANISFGNVAGRDIVQHNSTGSQSSPASGARDAGNEPQVAHLKRKRDVLQRNLNELKMQEAKFGSLYVPVHIKTQIDDTQSELVAVNAQIAQLGG